MKPKTVCIISCEIMIFICLLPGQVSVAERQLCLHRFCSRCMAGNLVLVDSAFLLAEIFFY